MEGTEGQRLTQHQIYIDQTMNLVQEKIQLRATMLRKRRDYLQKLSADKKTSLELAVTQNFLTAFTTSKPLIIAGYWPLVDEFDCKNLLHILHKQSCKVCLPVVDPKASILKFHQWTPQTHLVKAIFGIMVPENETETLEPDLVLVPLVAFDSYGHRLGYGRGYYDFTLEHFRKKRKVLSIGLGYDIQRVDKISAEATDQPLDQVITETNIVEFKVRK